MTQMKVSKKQKQTHTHREQICGCQGGGGGGGKDWGFGISRCKLLYIGWIKNKVLLYSTGNYRSGAGWEQSPGPVCALPAHREDARRSAFHPPAGSAGQVRSFLIRGLRF